MILAIDVGGTKMAAGLVAHDGTVTAALRAPTPQNADAETLWNTLTGLLEPLADSVDGVGVGCGGPMTWPDGEVSPLNIPGWRGFPLRARLAARFPGLPVRLHNDAICLAVAEHWKGAGQGSADMLGMVVSTGVGGGLILNGRLVNGGTGNAGHIGHVIVEPEGGPRCGCGGHGCLEAVARGPGLTAWALEQGWIPGALSIGGEPSREGGRERYWEGGGERYWEGGGELSREGGGERYREGGGEPSREGGGERYREGGGERYRESDGELSRESRWEPYREDRAVTGRALAADALAGDPVALRAMRRAGRALGMAIASATHLCDLDLVTIGGGLSQAGEPLFGPLEEALREHARMEFARRLKVMPAALGQEAGLIGAAALILAGENYWS